MGKSPAKFSKKPIANVKGWVQPLGFRRSLGREALVGGRSKKWALHLGFSSKRIFMAETLLPEGAATLDWLRSSESLFDLMPEIYFFAKDGSGRFIAVNQGFVQKRAGQANKSDVLGFTDFDFWPRHLSEKYVQGDKQVMDTEKNLVNFVELAVKPDHSTEWLSTTKVPLYDRHNRIAGIAGYCRDLKVQNQQESLMHMSEVFDHVMRNYKSDINLKDLASLTYLSISQFERRFKGLFGITPMQYLSWVRTDAACQDLVEGTGKISEIALQSGFYDSSHFSRHFQKFMGISPGEYRRRYANTRDYPRVPSLQIGASLRLMV
jgi:AraC-like DNA-binding protein